MNIIKKLKAKISSKSYLEYLRYIGCNIGEGTEIFSNPINVFIDPSRPFLIEIGKNCKITRNVTILTHGYDWSVLNGLYGDILGSSGKVSIGNNVFIGMNATILKGTTIGDNVIIGANSLVTSGNYPSNCVISGNPAKVICSIEEYHEKRIKRQLEEAVELERAYEKKYGKIPPKEIFHEFFWIFSEREKKIDVPLFEKMMDINKNGDMTRKEYKNTKPIFDSYEKFIEYCNQ